MSTPADLASRVERYYAALNTVDLAAVEAMFAEDAVYQSVGIGALNGRAAIMAAMKTYFAEFPDQVAEFDRIETEGGSVARTRWRLKATSKLTGLMSERHGIELLSVNALGLIQRIEVQDL